MNKICYVELMANTSGDFVLTINRGPWRTLRYIVWSEKETNRAARFARFFLAWLSRQPGAQLERKSRKVPPLIDHDELDWATLVADAIYPEGAE